MYSGVGTADTLLLQVRVSSALVKRIDMLCNEVLFRNRSEAISDTIRMLFMYHYTNWVGTRH